MRYYTNTTEQRNQFHTTAGTTDDTPELVTFEDIDHTVKLEFNSDTFTNYFFEVTLQRFRDRANELAIFCTSKTQIIFNEQLLLL